MDTQADLEMKVNKCEDHFKRFLKLYRSSNPKAALTMLRDVEAKLETISMYLENEINGY